MKPSRNTSNISPAAQAYYKRAYDKKIDTMVEHIRIGHPTLRAAREHVRGIYLSSVRNKEETDAKFWLAVFTKLDAQYEAEVAKWSRVAGMIQQS